MLTKLDIGTLIFYAKNPIALLIKPENEDGSLWKVGLLVDYKTNDLCTIINSKGEYTSWKRDMIMPYRVLNNM